MARDEAAPFPRGATLYNGGTIDSNNLAGINYEGKEYKFEDTKYGTDQYVTCRIVRNNGPLTLLPGRLCQFDPSYFMDRINGYVTVSNGPGVILDEFLPSAGLVQYDLGYVIVEGPTLAWTPLDGGADNVIAFMDPLVAITAATSGATTAGRLNTSGTGGQSTCTRDQILNVIGRALSAQTTANTGVQMLIEAKRWF